MARPKQAILTRERIGLAAVALLDAGHELQVTPLAKRLGVSVSSLYHHVSGRADIAHAMREAVIAQNPATELPTGNWQAQVRHALDRLWRTYSSHPRAVPLLLSVPVNEPELLQHYSLIIDALRTAHVPEHQLVTTVEVLDAYAMGAALDSLTPSVAFEGFANDTSLGQLLDQHHTGPERNRQVYEHGLTLLLAGIAATSVTGSAAPPAR